uniref:Uncharacterized protein n=1 Tax=Vitis vinifera TaxID=29760 RepID=A5AK03_VITVI|nr:hypothetical protein VITISV_039572 [Vitis vinifera]
MAYTDKPRLPSGFKVSAESGTTRPSRIRLDTCRDETDTRYGIMNELDWELWTEYFIGGVDKTTPHNQIAPPPMLGTVTNLRLQVVSSVVGLDNMVVCEGGRLRALLWVLTAMVARTGDWGSN